MVTDSFINESRSAAGLGASRTGDVGWVWHRIEAPSRRIVAFIAFDGRAASDQGQDRQIDNVLPGVIIRCDVLLMG
jgi:hypothetical protein